ncbi:hypothetical protein [Roseiconus nitratireducens]|uniref:hypothetical protein n=1 Tax=Roseiconus nitratireducens TaxID=2605748 RepID=UPI001375B0DE|nr:hypothetical protein [Roseiconus nitratireducens]
MLRLTRYGGPNMPCDHLKELYQLCEEHDLKIASTDMVRIVCRQCGEQDVCPTALTDGDKVLELGETSEQDRPPSGDAAGENPSDP